MMMHNCIYSFRQSFDSNSQFWPYQSGNQIFFPRIDNICSKVFIKSWSRSMPPGLWLPFLSPRSRVAEFRFSSKAAADAFWIVGHTEGRPGSRIAGQFPHASTSGGSSESSSSSSFPLFCSQNTAIPARLHYKRRITNSR